MFGAARAQNKFSVLLQKNLTFILYYGNILLLYYGKVTTFKKLQKERRKGTVVTMKKLISLALAALTLISCALAFSSCSKKQDEFVIGITYFAPMNYIDDNGELTGFETEFAKAVCEKLDLKPRFQKIDWKAKENELNSGNIDCIWNGMTIDDDRRATMAISNPYMTNKQVLIVREDNVEKFSDEEALAGASIVAEAGSAGETMAKENEKFADCDYTPVDVQSKALMEVKAGTADACIVDYVLSIGSIGEGTDYADLAIAMDIEATEEQYGIAFKKGNEDTVKKFNDAIAELMKDGTIDKIAEKYKLAEQLIK